MLSLEELEEELVFQQLLLDTLPSNASAIERTSIERELVHIQGQIEALTNPPSLRSSENSLAQTNPKRARAFSSTDDDGDEYHARKSRRSTPFTFVDPYPTSDEDDDDDDDLPADLSDIFSRKMSTQPSTNTASDVIRKAAERERERERQRAQTRTDEAYARQVAAENAASSSFGSASTFRPFHDRPNMSNRSSIKSEDLVQRSLTPNGTLQHLDYPSMFGSSTSSQHPTSHNSRVNDVGPSVRLSDHYGRSVDQRGTSVKAERKEPIPSRFPMHLSSQGHNGLREAPPKPMSIANIVPRPLSRVKPDHETKNGILSGSPRAFGSPVVTHDDFVKNELPNEQPRYVFDMTQSNSSSSSLEEISASEFRPHEKELVLRPGQTIANTHNVRPGHKRDMIMNRQVPSSLGNTSGGLYGPQSQYTAPGSNFNTLYNSMTDSLAAFSRSVAAVTGRYAQIPGTPSSSSTAAASAYERNNYLYADNSRSAEEVKKILDSIRGDAELPAHMRKGTPEQMAIVLLEHQKLGLTWLMDKEEKLKGSILADDMGLGKTIQALALMISRPSDDPRRKTTLIVAPVALMAQWESEIEEKIKKRYALSVYRYHGSKKVEFSHLRSFDVVITTYGSITSEFKRHEKMMLLKKEDPNVSFKDNPKYRLALVGDHCQWYRVILDEAQNIKNKNALCSKAVAMLNATYRLCLTGTPLQNNVDELFPLLRFTRLRPYCDWEEFRKISLKLRGSKTASDFAIRKLQALIRATMLRRTKTSKLDGKPLINLPERITQDDAVTFSADEQEFYTTLQTKNQATIKNMITKGVLGKNYSCALTLLLRMRQACNHQSLVFFGESSETLERVEGEPEQMANLAKELAPDVIERIKAAEANFECPICFDATENPAIPLPCGHWLCLPCFASMKDSNARDSESHNDLRCPQCRSQLIPTRITDFQAFKEAHQPELLSAAERAALDPIAGNDDDGSDTDSDDSESETESDVESDTEDDTLGGFIVGDDDDGTVDAESSRRRSLSKKVTIKKFVSSNKKGKRPAKSKEKEAKEDQGRKSLAQLKKEGMRNRAARRRYFKRLEKWYTPSAKIVHTIKLLKDISESYSGEKVLIFSQFTSFLDLLEVGLRRAGYKLLRYDGSMTTDARTAAVDEFKKDSSIPVMLLSLKAGNAGLNLNFASHVLILDPFWHGSIEDQAADRAHRIGQRRTVHVHRVVVPGTVEDRILALQEEKRAIINAALDEKAGKKIGRLGTRELAYLFGLDERGQQLPAVTRPLLTAQPSGP